jgi:hypothetical protein
MLMQRCATRLVGSRNDDTNTLPFGGQVLYRIVAMFQDYLGAFDEQSVRDNFVLIYELLDELIDFGYPQHTGPEVLKLYVTQKGLKNESKKMEEIKKRCASRWLTRDISPRRPHADWAILRVLSRGEQPTLSIARMRYLSMS